MIDLKLFGSIHPNGTPIVRCPMPELYTHDTQQHTACFTALGPVLPLVGPTDHQNITEILLNMKGV
jgi:hypothetical protein